MIDQRNVAVPWIPMADMPQSPCGIEVDAAPGWVTVRAVYSFYEGERDLIIEMRSPIACLFDDAVSPPIHFPENYPNLTDSRWLQYRWPFMRVENSSWLEANCPYLFKNLEYEHVRIVSDDGILDAIIERSSDSEYRPNGLENVEWAKGKGKELYIPSYRAT